MRFLGEEDPGEPGSLAEKPAGTRLMIMGAGPFMNAVLAIFLFSLLFMLPRDVLVGQVLIQEVYDNSPAKEAGLLAGDIVVEATGRTLNNHNDLIYLVDLKLGSRMTWIVERGGQRITVLVMPRLNPPVGEFPVGIELTTVNSHVESRSDPPWSAAQKGITRMGEVLILIKTEFTKWTAGGSAPEIVGPIGIGNVFVQVGQAEGFSLADRISFIIQFAAIISMVLAIFNILPIPALDGGRIMFVVIEMARRGKRISPQREGFVHMVGFAAIITFLLFISFVDITKLGDNLLGG